VCIILVIARVYKETRHLACRVVYFETEKIKR